MPTSSVWCAHGPETLRPRGRPVVKQEQNVLKQDKTLKQKLHDLATPGYYVDLAYDTMLRTVGMTESIA